MDQAEAIKHLTDSGFTVFPVALVPDGDRVNKIPTVEGWQKEPPSGVDWTKQFQPGDVIGVQLPLGTVVLDIDDPAKFAKTQLEANGSVSSPTRRAGGEHRFYRTDGRPVKQTQKGSQLGFDTRVGGKGFVVAWHPENWTSVESWGMAPEWMYDLAEKSTANEPLGRDEGIPRGERHQYFVALAGRLRNLGLDEPGILAVLRAECARRSPDHDDKDLVDIAAWVADQEQTLPPDMASFSQSRGSVGGNTLYDLPHGDAEPQLADPFLAAEGVTVIYGPGGVGKGWVSLHLISRLVRSGKTVEIIDYENHPGEWGRRARQLGLTDGELKKVLYRAPFGDDWTAGRGTLNQVANLLRSDADAHNVDYFIIDSYTTASPASDSMGGAAGAQAFFDGIKRLGKPALVIAHVASNQGGFPDKPFGSVFVHNLARETWAVERYDDEAEDLDPLAAIFEKVMRLELRNKKMNVGEKPAVQFINFKFQYTATGTQVEVDRIPPINRKSTAQLIREVLTRSKAPMTLTAIAKAIKESTGVIVKADTLRKTLNRNFSKDESGAVVKWAVDSKSFPDEVSGGVSADEVSTGHEPDTLLDPLDVY